MTFAIGSDATLISLPLCWPEDVIALTSMAFALSPAEITVPWFYPFEVMNSNSQTCGLALIARCKRFLLRSTLKIDGPTSCREN